MTSDRPHRLSLTARRGFTLIEMLVVLAIVAGMMGAAVYGLNTVTAANLRDEAMRLTSVMQFTWSRAAVEQVNYRLVIDLDKNTYWTEVSDANVVKALSEAGDLRRQMDKRAENDEIEQEEGLDEDSIGYETDPFGISQATSFTRAENAAIEPKNFHDGIEIYQVLTTRQDAPITDGVAAVSFFPDGFQEPVIIVLRDSHGAFYSVINEPLTGRVKIYSRLIENRDRLDQGESDD